MSTPVSACLDTSCLEDRRGSTFSWVVPVDDTRCFSIGWSDIDKEFAIPGRTGYVDRRSSRGAYVVGAGDVGQIGAPAYEERQRAPGDWDAWGYPRALLRCTPGSIWGPPTAA